MASSGIGIGNIISGIVGAVAVIVVAYLREYLDKRTRKRKLRSALLAELKSTNSLGAAVDMLRSDSGNYFYTHHDFIPTDVYESNLDDIGLLSENEISSIVNYYNRAIIAKEERAGTAIVVDDEERSFTEEASAVTTLTSTLEYLQTAREEAIEALESEMDSTYRQDDDGSEEDRDDSAQSNRDEIFSVTNVVDGILPSWKGLRQSFTMSELALVLLVVPFILVSVEASVESQQWVLPLDVSSIAQLDVFFLAFTSSYVHTGPAHLWGNIIGYVLIMSALFPLAVVAGEKRKLAAVSAFNLLVIPFLASQVSLILPFDSYTSGFSGVNGAFLGSLFIFIFLAWHAETDEVNPLWSLVPALFSIGVALAIAPKLIPYLPLLSQYVLIFAVSGTLLSFYFLYSKGVSPLRYFLPQVNSALYWGLAVSVVSYLGLFVLISEDTNLLSHLAGFYIGFFALFTVIAGRVGEDLVQSRFSSNATD